MRRACTLYLTETHHAATNAPAARHPRIALDVMGGDHAPQAVLAAAQAVRKRGEANLVLVGPETLVASSGFEFALAREAVTMDDKPGRILREKPDSSMKVAIELVRDGKVDGAVSAGNTGAFMAISLLTLGRLPDIDRPALGGVFPTRHGRVCLIDVGANADAKPQYLLQFGLMGSVYMEKIFGIPSPTVGLLNIGHEEGKGNQFTLQAHALLKESTLNFFGNVEGSDVPEGTVDVVVCDGFTGNVLAKASEGLASVLSGWIREEIRKEWFGQVGAALLRPAFARVRRRLDVSEHGAAPLFGVNGLAVKTHGGSNARGIEYAIGLAAHAARQDLIGSMKSALEQGSKVQAAG